MPPPGTMPSSAAARVACRASSTRPLVCFISASVAAPTRMIATPPDSLASRSLELLLVVLALGLLHLAADLVDPLLDLGLLAGPLDDRRAVLFDLDLLGLAELVELDVLQLEAEVLADERAAGQDGDVAEHRLAAVAEAGGLDGADVQDAAELVDDQGRQRLALDVLGDDQERLARLRDLLQQRQHVADVADLLLVDQDQGVLEARTSIVVGLVTK